MIKVVVMDIDGCLTPGEVEEIDLGVLKKLREYNQRSKDDPLIPAITFCTGRPQPYLEAMHQMLSGYLPAIYESGGGMYFPQGYYFRTNPKITESLRQELGRITNLVEERIAKLGIAKIQPGKETSLSLYPTPGYSTSKVLKITSQLFKEENLSYSLVDGLSCINILPPRVDKGEGVRWLSRVMKIRLNDLAGIGDSDGDLPFLRLVGAGACPRNANDKVKKVVKYVSPYSNGKSILDIFNWCIKRNVEAGL
ncbi:MAG: hypothetical protein COS84_10530 [Armatimonadetes bacterium CG07_land_8_20_14_0_80_40_9]|nr:MAG: hypothetical protein COS84_10530 [Armatimonadetes bacterium CG07_land_8_20_14_0_80_40_9]